MFITCKNIIKFLLPFVKCFLLKRKQDWGSIRRSLLFLHIFDLILDQRADSVCQTVKALNPDEILSVAKNYGLYLGKLMTYEASEKKLIEDGYGTLSGYCNNVLRIPALTVNLGNGAAPLALTEFNAIWNATRESWSALQVKMIDW